MTRIINIKAMLLKGGTSTAVGETFHGYRLFSKWRLWRLQKKPKDSQINNFSFFMIKEIIPGNAWVEKDAEGELEGDLPGVLVYYKINTKVYNPLFKEYFLDLSRAYNQKCIITHLPIIKHFRLGFDEEEDVKLIDFLEKHLDVATVFN